MADGKINLKSKIQASTILEVVVSMVIIVLVFGTAMMIYANVLRLSLSTQKIKAEAILQKILIQDEQTKNQSTQTQNIDDIRVEQEVKPYAYNDDLAEIHLTAYDVNQQKITELYKIIINR